MFINQTPILLAWPGPQFYNYRSSTTLYFTIISFFFLVIVQLQLLLYILNKTPFKGNLLYVQCSFNFKNWPWLGSQLVGASSCTPKAAGSIPGQGAPWAADSIPVSACGRRPVDWCFSLTSMSLSLPHFLSFCLSLPPSPLPSPSLKSLKHILKRGFKKKIWKEKKKWKQP